jgi:hypothetical protein
VVAGGGTELAEASTPTLTRPHLGGGKMVRAFEILCGLRGLSKQSLLEIPFPQDGGRPGRGVMLPTSSIPTDASLNHFKLK